MRFHIYRSGERIPCWISALRSQDDTYIMITIEMPDWTAVADVIEKYLEEVREVVTATRGHAELIAQSVTRAKADRHAPNSLASASAASPSVIDIHMYRLRALTDLIERLERIRTGKVRDLIRTETRRDRAGAISWKISSKRSTKRRWSIPKRDAGDYRRRIRAVIPQKIAAAAAPEYLAQVLRDVLRNAIMYSMRAAPDQDRRLRHRDNAVQIDVIDEGYGIRASRE